MTGKGFNAYEDSKPGVGGDVFIPGDLRKARQGYIDAQPNLSGLSQDEIALQVQYREIERQGAIMIKDAQRAGNAAKAEKWQDWILDEKERARQKLRERHEREKAREDAAETARQAVDNFDKPLYLRLKHRL